LQNWSAALSQNSATIVLFSIEFEEPLALLPK
jgi:hypothetical protein